MTFTLVNVKSPEMKKRIPKALGVGKKSKWHSIARNQRCLYFNLRAFWFLIFLYLFMAARGFHYCVRTFLSCIKLGLLSSCGAQAAMTVASCVAEHGSRCAGFRSCGSRALAHGLSCSKDVESSQPGTELMSPYWQANS